MIKRVEYSSENYENSYSQKNNMDETLSMDIKVSDVIKRSGPEKFSIVLKNKKVVFDNLTLQYLRHLNRDLKIINNYI